jgi:hypothetical protein
MISHNGESSSRGNHLSNDRKHLALLWPTVNEITHEYRFAGTTVLIRPVSIFEIIELHQQSMEGICFAMDVGNNVELSFTSISFVGHDQEACISSEQQCPEFIYGCQRILGSPIFKSDRNRAL